MVNKRKLSKRRTYGKKLSRRFKKKVSKRVSKKRFSKRVSKKRFSKRFSKKRMKKRQYNKYVKRGGSFGLAFQEEEGVNPLEELPPPPVSMELPGEDDRKRYLDTYRTPDGRFDTRHMQEMASRAAAPATQALNAKRERVLRAKQREVLVAVDAWLDELEEEAAQRNAEAEETVRVAKEETSDAERNLEDALEELQDYVTEFAWVDWGVVRAAVKTAATVVGQDQKIVCQAANRLRDISLPKDERGHEYYHFEDNPFPLGDEGFAIVKKLIHGAYYGYIIFPNEETDPRRSYIKTILDYLVDH